MTSTSTKATSLSGVCRWTGTDENTSCSLIPSYHGYTECFTEVEKQEACRAAIGQGKEFNH